MKKIFLIVLLAVSFVMQSQELKWYDKVSEASEISLKTHKPLFFFFTGSDWCGWCMRLQKEVFFTPEFAKWANDNVVLVELDFPRNKVLDPAIKQQNKDLEQMFGIRGYPTVWIVSPTKVDGKISFERLGSTGYGAGGPIPWTANADLILKNKK